VNEVNVYVTYETNYIIDDVHFDVNIYLLITGQLSIEINLNKEIKTFNNNNNNNTLIYIAPACRMTSEAL